MGTVRGLLTSFRSAAFERVNSPVTGSFALSWLFWNWQAALLLVFGDDKFETRLASAAQYIGFWSGFILPAISAVVICTLLPRLNVFVFNIQKAPNQESNEMAYERQKDSLLKSIELNKLSAQDDTAYETEKASFQLLIAQKQELIEKAESARERDRELISDLQKQLSITEQKLLEANNALENVKPEIDSAAQSRSQAWSLMRNMTQEIEAGKQLFIEFYDDIEPKLYSNNSDKKDFAQIKYRIINCLENAISLKDRGG